MDPFKLLLKLFYSSLWCTEERKWVERTGNPPGNLSIYNFVNQVSKQLQFSKSVSFILSNDEVAKRIEICFFPTCDNKCHIGRVNFLKFKKVKSQTHESVKSRYYSIIGPQTHQIGSPYRAFLTAERYTKPRVLKVSLVSVSEQFITLKGDFEQEIVFKVSFKSQN